MCTPVLVNMLSSVLLQVNLLKQVNQGNVTTQNMAKSSKAERTFQACIIKGLILVLY